MGSLINSNIKISFIIPVFNGSQYILTCLNSIFSQESTCIFEVIVVNDGSIDDTEKILIDYSHLCNGCLRVFTIMNSGPAKARHFGLGLSLGEFVMFLDVDDLLKPGFFNVFSQKLFIEDVDILLGQVEVRKSGKIIDRSHYNLTSSGKISDFLTGNLPTTLWPHVYRRHILIDLNFYYDFFVGEDFLLNCQLISNDNLNYVIFDQVIYVHNYTKLSLSKSPTFVKFEQNYCAYISGIEILRNTTKVDAQLESDFCLHLIKYFISLILIGSPFAIKVKLEFKNYSDKLIDKHLANFSLFKRLLYYVVMYLPFNILFLKGINFLRYFFTNRP
jgi:glycosyltransferase involved in cell wall biosynthesis